MHAGSSLRVAERRNNRSCERNRTTPLLVRLTGRQGRETGATSGFYDERAGISRCGTQAVRGCGRQAVRDAEPGWFEDAAGGWLMTWMPYPQRAWELGDSGIESRVVRGRRSRMIRSSLLNRGSTWSPASAPEVCKGRKNDGIARNVAWIVPDSPLCMDSAGDVAASKNSIRDFSEFGTKIFAGGS